MDGDVDLNNVPYEVELGTPQPEAPSCPFCLISEGKIDAKIVYSDDRFFGVLDINPANPGHVLLFPKFHYASFADMSDDLASRMFVTAKKLCAVLVETLHAKGFNIFLAEGQIAGQNVPHVLLHLIPRYDQDGLSFFWKSKTLSEEDMKNVADLIKSFSFKKEEPVKQYFFEIDEEERVA